MPREMYWFTALLCHRIDGGMKEWNNSKHKRLLIETSIEDYYNTNDLHSLIIHLQWYFLKLRGIRFQFTVDSSCLFTGYVS